jgi:hypothetical protein
MTEEHHIQAVTAQISIMNCFAHVKQTSRKSVNNTAYRKEAHTVCTAIPASLYQKQ